MRVLICGGGALGACVAYFLARRGAEAVIVERTGVACAASGKSGGFLALDWCDGTPLQALARRSFELHGWLAEQLSGAWGYRRLDTWAVAASDQRGAAGRRSAAMPGWVGPEAQVRARLGGKDTTAQVDPGAFTRAMIEAAMANGAALRIGTVERLVLAGDGRSVGGAIVDGEHAPADAVVIAMGPWSSVASRWLPLPAVHGLKGNSIVLRSQRPISADALFVDYEDRGGEMQTPEVFPRVDGTTYICGLSSRVPLPADPAQVTPDPGACDELQRMASRFAPPLGAAEVLAKQACYRPIATDGLPLLGRVAGVTNAFVATAHSVWGILNAPASGEALAELIVDGHASRVDLSPFDPGRLPASRPGAGS
jgi:glycine/D-amino acid oxidase-like deaminating enzyme